MSYLVLARKWRPQTFEDVVGQQAVVRTLRNALLRDRVAHAMLFSGVRGVGKTTLARLMAKALNCREGAPDVPCNQCESCRTIMAGNAVDLHEIDGASNRGIQEIRELKENIRFFPSLGRYKVIIIDEVHMLTTEAFNALLKTLEEPPSHVYFMFATTEIHKIPITILSRCQRYELKRVQFTELVDFFAKIAAAEQVRISRQALEMIGREAEGSVRDGLSLLDQILSFGGEEISDRDVVEVLGLVDRRVFENLARALLTADLAASLDLFDKAFNAGLDLKRFANELLGFFRALLIIGISPRPEEVLDVSDQELAALREIAATASREAIHQAFMLLLKGVEEMQHSLRPRIRLEMAFVSVCQAGQLIPTATLLARLDALLAGVEPLPAPKHSGWPQPQTITAEQEPSLVRATEEPPPAAAGAAPAQAVAPIPAVELPPAPEPAPSPVMAELPPDRAWKEEVSVSDREVKRRWDGFIAYVRERKAWMAPILELCAAVRTEGSTLILKYDDPSVCKVLEERDHLKLLTEFAQDFFQHGFRLVLKIRGADSGGDNAADAPMRERQALVNDPLVQMTLEIFGGQLGGVRTGPTSR